MKRVGTIRKLHEPLRPLHGALFEMIKNAVADSFEIAPEAYTNHYAGGRFEVAGRSFLLLVVPEKSAFAVLHRKGSCAPCLGAQAGQSGDLAAREGGETVERALPPEGGEGP
jgi:hypothetical protein